MVAGFAIAVTGLGAVTPGRAALGIAAGLGLMLPGHIIGATGAGDVKLFAAAGAVIGAGRILPAFLYTALAGGVIAILVARVAIVVVVDVVVRLDDPRLARDCGKRDSRGMGRANTSGRPQANRDAVS